MGLVVALGFRHRRMSRIRESVNISAPPERVWAVVQEDVVHAPRWTTNLEKVEKLDTGPPRVGTRYRYHLDLPGGIKERLEVQQDVFGKPKRCSGRFIKGPLKGDWSYTYTERKDGTHVVYEMDFELTGLLRFAGGLLARQYAEGIRENMKRLKAYIEAGKGPKAK
jgi:uncharacterized membrane protein